MKRSKLKQRPKHYPKRQPRPKNAGNLIARRLIVRALRKAGLHRVLKGGMATVGFLYTDSVHETWLKGAASDLCRDLTPRNDADHLMFDSGKPKRPSGNIEANSTLLESHLLFGFAREDVHFPVAFRAVADCIISLEDVDASDIAIAFRAIMKVDAPFETVQAIAGLPDGMASALIKRGRRLPDVVNIVNRQVFQKPVHVAAPTIDDLSGYGELAEWGKSLVADLASYRSGSIQWEDVDRGALISGESGTGKTFFAQALATSCGVPLYAHSLMRWQAKGHLGDLLNAMRNAFEQAIANAPSILFLDEFDAFGSRDRFSGDNEHYCSEVVNALLECLDGVERRPGVVVIGATNFPDRIDAALLRPGRLGRHLQILLPDFNARSGILRHHLGDAIVDADLSDVAVRLEGATGASIEQMVRDARRRARTANREMELRDLAEAMPVKGRLSESAFQRTCIHEAGHGVVGYVLREECGANPVEIKVFRELSPSRQGAGHTGFDCLRGLDRSRRTYDASIATLLAGLAAEKLLLGAHSDMGGGSAGSDLHQATVLAAGVVVSFGLDGSLTYLGCDTPEDLLARVRTDAALQLRVEEILSECFQRAESILLERKHALQRLADTLSAAMTVGASEIAEMVG